MQALMSPVSKLGNWEYKSGKSAQPGGFPSGVLETSRWIALVGRFDVCGDSLFKGSFVLWHCEKSCYQLS